MANDDLKTRKRNSGGGWNKKPLDEHVANNTYRPDRHGKLPDLLDFPAKPPGKVEGGLRLTKEWCRNVADERAMAEGCRFNMRLAEHVDKFFCEMLCHSAGRWAGKPFVPTDWQRQNLLWPLFGWVTSEGQRRFRRTYIEMPKKQGKSALASGIGLYGLTADGEAGAEVYSFGADRDQAAIVHKEAINMVEWSPSLNLVLKINRSTQAIYYRGTKSYYQSCSGAPRGKHGLKAHFGICDELHEWFGPDLWEAIRYAYRMRTEPLNLVITNAGDDLESVCYNQRKKARLVLRGEDYDEGFFALIYSAERDAAEAEVASVRAGATELPVARSCNPHLGIITQEPDLLQDIKDAILTPSEMANMLRLTYGVWEASADPWLSTIDWDANLEEFTEAQLVGRPCWGGLDLSRKRDMTSLVLMFRDDDGSFRQLAWFWLPTGGAEKLRKYVDVDTWKRDGWLRVTPSPTTDFAVVERDIAELAERFEIESISYDPMYATELVSRLEKDHDLETIEFPQTILQFALPTAEYERWLLDGALRHDGNPILRWQASHVQTKRDANANLRPIKPEANDHRKIDGIVAGIMAMRGALTASDSYYEQGEVRHL